LLFDFVQVVPLNKGKGERYVALGDSFLIIALIAGFLGVSGVSAVSAEIAWILFAVFLVLFVISLLTGSMRSRPPV
jgi:uncharacterized membrane protein YtjA (UPF0391 family)